MHVCMYVCMYVCMHVMLHNKYGWLAKGENTLFYKYRDNNLYFPLLFKGTHMVVDKHVCVALHYNISSNKLHRTTC